MKKSNCNHIPNNETQNFIDWVRSGCKIQKDLHDFKKICEDRHVFAKHIVGEVVRHCSGEDENYQKMSQVIGDITQVDFYEVADALLAD